MGLNNNQRIRVICGDVGFVTTVAGAFEMPFTHQRIAVTSTLLDLGLAVIQEPYTMGRGASQTVYGPDNERMVIDVTVDLL